MSTPKVTTIKLINVINVRLNGQSIHSNSTYDPKLQNWQGIYWIWVFWVRDSFESTTPRGCYGNVVQLPIGINLHSPHHHPAISEKKPAAPALTSEYARSSPRNLAQSRKRASQWKKRRMYPPRNLAQSRKRASQWKKRRVYPWRIHIP